MTNNQIRESIGASISTIAYQRRKREDWIKRRDWTGTDWSKSNDELAKITGKHRATVSNARKKFCPGSRKPRRKGVRPMAWSWVDWSLPTSEIAKALGVSQSSVSNARRKYAPHTI